MSQRNHLKQLLINHNLRLQALQQTKALKGLDAPPDVTFEIENIEAEIEKLQAELQEFEQQDVESISTKTLEQRSASQYYNEGYLGYDYGIKITYPDNEPVVGDTVEVRGTYSVIPPHDTLRLFTVHPEKTENLEERFWPQEIVKEFSQKTKTWKAKVHVGGLPSTGASIIVAIVSQPTIILWNFYYKVGPKIGWWDIEGWPNDSIEYDRVPITRV